MQILVRERLQKSNCNRELIAKNTGVNGSVVTEKVLSSDNPKFGYNAANGSYEDLMAAGIIDPTKKFNEKFITGTLQSLIGKRNCCLGCLCCFIEMHTGDPSTMSLDLEATISKVELSCPLSTQNAENDCRNQTVTGSECTSSFWSCLGVLFGSY